MHEIATRWMRRVEDANIWRVYLTTLGLGLAYGMAISLIAIFLDKEGFDKGEIGVLAAAFAAGIVCFSLPMGSLIRRFSAKVTLSLSLLGYSATIVAFPFLSEYAAVAVVRFLDGAFSVAIWVSCETILLSRARAEHKAFVMSLYAIAMAFGYVGGPVLAQALAGVAPLSTGFVAAGVVAAIAGFYVLWRLDGDSGAEGGEGIARNATGTRRYMRPGELLYRIKNSCFATFSYGYFQASVVLFLPLYLIEEKGIAESKTIVIPAFFAAGMLLFTNVAGHIGDRKGHLLTMRWLGAIGMMMILGFVYLSSYELMCGAVFVAGASLASISPVSLALQGAVVPRSEYGRATSMYNAFYAGGMLLGPPISSAIFESSGGPAMLFHLACLWGLFVLFTLAFYRDDPMARAFAGQLGVRRPRSGLS